jgi:hypothetical protein
VLIYFNFPLSIPSSRNICYEYNSEQSLCFDMEFGEYNLVDKAQQKYIQIYTISIVVNVKKKNRAKKRDRLHTYFEI